MLWEALEFNVAGEARMQQRGGDVGA